MMDTEKCRARSHGAAPLPAVAMTPLLRARGSNRPQSVTQSGVTLIELMIGVTIGLLLLLGLFTLIAAQSRAFQMQDSNFGRLRENAHAALRYIGDSVRHAGFYGYARGPTFVSLTTDAALATTGDCGSSGNPPTSNWALQVTVPIYGVSDLTPSNVNGVFPCIKAANFASGPGTRPNPILVTRGAGGFRITSATLASQPNYATTLYVQGDPIKGLLFKGGNFSSLKASNLTRKTFYGDDVDIFEYRAHVYYIRPCTRALASNGQCAASDDGGRPIPTLARQELFGAAMTEVPLVEGIERIDYRYGIDDRPALDSSGRSCSGPPENVPQGECRQSVTGELRQSPTGDLHDGAKDDGHLVGTGTGIGVPTRYTPAPLASEWSNVVAVKVSVLVRAHVPTPGYSDAGKQYDLDGDGVADFTCTMTGAGADACSYKRKVFSQTFLIRNVAQRSITARNCDSAKDHDCAINSSDKSSDHDKDK